MIKQNDPRHRYRLSLRLSFIVIWSIYLLTFSACAANSPSVALHVENTVMPLTTDLPVVIVATATPLTFALPTAARVRRMLDAVQSDQLLFTVDALSAMGTRHVLSAGFDPSRGIGISAARNFLIDQFRTIQADAPLTVWSQSVTVTFHAVTATSDNVIAIKQGTDLNAGVIVVGAHYDTLNAADPGSADMAAPGANANGSGVAALLEIARIVAAEPLRATVIFAAFTAKETGRQGSAAFIRNYLQAQSPPIVPRAMLNLDTLGASLPPGNLTTVLSSDMGDLPGVIRVFSADPNDSPSRQLARQVQLSASLYSDLPRVIVQSSAERSGRFSDQQSFSAVGVPAIHLIEGIEDSTRQLNAADTLDDIRPAYLVGATQVALTVVLALADGLSAPHEVRWQAASSTLSWSPVSGAAGYVVALRHSESASFDQTLVVGALPTFQWAALTHYDFAAVAAFDRSGELGPLSLETLLSRSR